MRWGEWISDRKLSWAEAGRRIGVSTSEARHFAHGRVPRKPTMQRIYLATGGQVTPNDFYDLPKLPETRAA
jgi:hypothetical protein